MSIEWTGLGTIATGLRAHDVEHDNYKINIDWDTQYFDIVVTEDFNYLNGRMDINFANLDDIIIGGNQYLTSLQVLEGIMTITIYDASNQNEYNFERNYPFTIRLAKEGIYVLHGSTSHPIMERDYDLDAIAIYYNEDGLDNEPVNPYENGDYDVAFDLVVSERSNEAPGEDVIEWTGIGTVASDLFAYAQPHSNYKINLDWENECFDVIIKEELNYNFRYINEAYIGNIVIGDCIYCISYGEGYTGLYNGDGYIAGSSDISEEGQYALPQTMRFTKDGIYLIVENTPYLLTERPYEINQPIYIYEDNAVNNGANTNTNYDLKFDLAVSELSNEEPDNNELVQGDINEDGTFNDESTTVVRTKYIDISDKKSIQVKVLTDNVYISACYLYNANKELVKVIEIPAGKKRKFGVNLQELIAQIIEDEGGDQ